VPATTGCLPHILNYWNFYSGFILQPGAQLSPPVLHLHFMRIHCNPETSMWPIAGCQNKQTSKLLELVTLWPSVTET